MAHSITIADVAAWGKFSPPEAASTEETLLQRVIDSVAEHVEERYQIAVDTETEETVWTNAQEQALILQASRLWRRRDTPEGIAAFADISAIRVAALDADVAMLLTPQFGFA